MRNPDVTVRSRGVMEKCTYCVQRINRARIEARNEGRPIRDGEIRTACQAGLPGARPSSSATSTTRRAAVSKLKAEPRNYGLLAELQHPAAHHLPRRVRNPNPEMPRPAGARSRRHG